MNTIATTHRWQSRLSSNAHLLGRFVLTSPVVVIFAAHLGILCDAPLPVFPADQSAAHRAGYQAAHGHQDGGSENQI